jgi:hypothetical protein
MYDNYDDNVVIILNEKQTNCFAASGHELYIL